MDGCFEWRTLQLVALLQDTTSPFEWLSPSLYVPCGWLAGWSVRSVVGGCLFGCVQYIYSTQFSVLLVLFLSSSVPPHFLWRGATFFRLRECLIYSDLALHFKRGINNESTHTRYSTVDVKK